MEQSLHQHRARQGVQQPRDRIAVAPLTAAVLAAVGDADLGEASAVNDATARVGGVVVIALVPALIRATSGRSISQALTHGYQPAMLILAGLCIAGALVTGLFVSDSRPAAPAPASSPRIHSCPLPTPEKS
jgi:hypothetical protein